MKTTIQQNELPFFDALRVIDGRLDGYYIDEISIEEDARKQDIETIILSVLVDRKYLRGICDKHGDISIYRVIGYIRMFARSIREKGTTAQTRDFLLRCLERFIEQNLNNIPGKDVTQYPNARLQKLKHTINDEKQLEILANECDMCKHTARYRIARFMRYLAIYGNDLCYTHIKKVIRGKRHF